jgi:hypothetical protein
MVLMLPCLGLSCVLSLPSQLFHLPSWEQLTDTSNLPPELCGSSVSEVFFASVGQGRGLNHSILRVCEEISLQRESRV